MEDHFSTAQRVGGIGSGTGERGGGAQAVMSAKLLSLIRSPTAQLLLCGLVPNRPQTGASPQPRGQGPLLQ